MAQLLKINYISEIGEDLEDESQKADIASVTIPELTDTLIQLKVSYSNPMAVSQESTVPDVIEITFDPAVFYDPNSDFQINDGEPMIVKLPR